MIQNQLRKEDEASKKKTLPAEGREDLQTLQPVPMFSPDDSKVSRTQFIKRPLHRFRTAD